MALIPPATLAALGPSGSGGTTPFSFGAVVFKGRNAPNRLPIGGGTQDVVEIKLAGGGKIVQAMGAQPDAILVEGTVYAPDVDSLIDPLRAYMVDGKERLVQWGSHRYYGVIKPFHPIYREGGLACDYKLEIVVSRDANGAFSLSTGASIDQQAADLQQQAQDQRATLGANLSPDAQALGITLPPTASLDASLTNVTVQVQQAGPLSQATASRTSSVLGSIGGAITQTQALLTILGPGTRSGGAAQGLSSVLTILRATIAAGQAQRTITPPLGSSLFTLAARIYGDPSRAFDLVSFNGLSSTRLPATVVTALRLPPLRKKRP